VARDLEGIMSVDRSRSGLWTWLLSVAVAMGLAACGGSGDSAGDADADVEADGAEGDGEDLPGDAEDGEVPRDEGGEVDADGEGDGDVPETDARECGSGGECADGNPCTLDECIGGFCRNSPVTDGTACDDDVFCMLPGTCAAGACTGIEENTCDDANACTDDLCDELLAECRHALHPRPGEEGPLGDASCSDGVDNDCDTLTDTADPNCIPCTGDTDCADGNECTSDSCGAGGICRNDPLTDGTVCNDGQYCNVDETCVAGACSGGAPRDCSAAGGVCNVGRCNETTDSCVPAPIADGSVCSDGLFCTLGETCAGGECGGGDARDCSALTDQCNVGICDEASGACVAQPATDGTTCDDGLFCTSGDSCQSGLCTGGAPVNCSALTNQCNVGTCDESGDACFAVPVAEGTSCSDGLACNVGEACAAGACTGGAALDCSAFTNQCNTGSCSETAGGCIATALPATTSCEDGLYCTTGDHCSAGGCVAGTARSCADSDTCTTDSCNDGTDVCDHVLTPVPGAEVRGTASCTDGVDNDCDRLTDAADPDCATCITAADCNDSNPCTVDTCTGGVCSNTAAPSGTTCNDGLYCTTPDRCTGTVCGGAARDCSASGNACNAGVCDETGDRCTTTPRPDTTTCEDGLYCTTGDHCSAGTCVAGPARDCSSATDQCNTGVCDDVGDRCTGSPLPPSTTCNDSLFCTTPDACAAGTCTGPARDCSAFGNQCNAGRCNDTTDACYADPLPAGTVCEADGIPATRDICLGGACLYSACGDGYWDTGAGEHCDDGNALTESCTSEPMGSCVRDCSIRQDTCGNGILEPEYGEACDDGDTDSFDGCTTSCTVNDGGIGSPCTCTGTCPVANPTAGTITGCSSVVAPTGSLVGCAHSGTISGNRLYFASGFCLPYAHRCRPAWMCGLAGIPSTVGNYDAFVGPCPAGSILMQYSVSSSGVTLETKSCQKVCTTDADCRWNEYDSYWRACGHYECMPSPSTPGINVCFDSQSSPP
jgi:hypothetical protein